MDPEEYLRQLITQALPFVEAWTDPDYRRNKTVPKGLGSTDEHAKLVRAMRDEASKTGKPK